MGCLIVAEVGVNHDGVLDKALALVQAAKKAGADAVKFQAFSSQALWGDDRIKYLELTQAELKAIHDYCQTQEIEFMCTPFGPDEVRFLTPLVRRWKVSSGCLSWDFLLQSMAATGLPMIVSTGMSKMHEIERAMELLHGHRVTLLHCTSAYPCPIDEVNLLAMDALAVTFDCDVGYSDHTEGINVALAAAALGATVIEKHLTHDRRAEGPDHKSSIEPYDFKRMVLGIREIEAALGSGEKTVMPSEVALRKVWDRD